MPNNKKLNITGIPIVGKGCPECGETTWTRNNRKMAIISYKTSRVWGNSIDNGTFIPIEFMKCSKCNYVKLYFTEV